MWFLSDKTILLGNCPRRVFGRAKNPRRHLRTPRVMSRKNGEERMYVFPVDCIQLFRQRLSHESVKAYATMPIGIMGSKSLALLD